MTTGAQGERAARAYLETHGLRFREANVRSPFGELDLVLLDPAHGELVIVEVRARGGTTFGTPEESLTARKRAALVRSVQWYVAQTRWTGPYRLDFVGILFRGDDPPTITHTPYVSLA